MSDKSFTKELTVRLKDGGLTKYPDCSYRFDPSTSSLELTSQPFGTFPLPVANISEAYIVGDGPCELKQIYPN